MHEAAISKVARKQVEYLTLEETAQYLRVEYKTILRLLEKGVIWTLKKGRHHFVRKDTLWDNFESAQEYLAGGEYVR